MVAFGLKTGNSAVYIIKGLFFYMIKPRVCNKVGIQTQKNWFKMQQNHN